MSKRLIVIGAGGHAAVLVDILRQQGFLPDYIVSPDTESLRHILSDLPYLISDKEVLKFDRSDTFLINGIGSLPGQTLRKEICRFFEGQGYEFKSVISDQAIVSEYASLGSGVQVMPGAIIQAGAVIGDHTIVNTGAIVDHDCIIGKYNHVAPGAVLSGQVTTGDYVHIGTGASIIQSVLLGNNVVVSAGAIVTRSVTEEKTIYGFRSVLK